MPVDIFPYIDIPIVSVLWVYSGLSPEEMEKRVVTNFERSLTSNVNDIEHIESQSYNGYAVVKIYFHPNVKIDMAVAQTTATMQTSLRQMPPGMFPANILKYDAASVPILQLGLSSKTLREQEIFDIGNNFIRTPLGTVQGASVSYPFGGKQRAVMVDLNLEELYAKQLSPIDVSNALNSAEPDSAGGHGKTGGHRVSGQGQQQPGAAQRSEQPADQDRERRDGLHQRRGAGARRLPVQNNIVRTNGSRGVLMTVTSNGKASTLSIVNAVKAALPRILANVPPELKVVALADQSVFVRASIQGVVREALIAAGLTGMMILLFLGSWRSTLIVCISIPLSILTSLCLLSLLGETINVMTLGGLALAVGILVDDATVEIENTHRNIAMRKPLVTRGAGWRFADRGADLRRHPVHLHRVRPGVAADRNRAVSVYAAGHGGGLRHARVVSAVAHAGADHDGLSARSRRFTVPARMRDAAPARAYSWRGHQLFNALFEGLRYRYVGLLDWSLRHRGRVLVRLRDFLSGIVGPGVAGGPGFLPRGGFRPDAAARARSRRHANRRDGDAVRRHRTRDPRRHSAGRDRDADRQHRHSEQLAQPSRRATFPPSRAPTARS